MQAMLFQLLNAVAQLLATWQVRIGTLKYDNYIGPVTYQTDVRHRPRVVDDQRGLKETFRVPYCGTDVSQILACIAIVFVRRLIEEDSAQSQVLKLGPATICRDLSAHRSIVARTAVSADIPESLHMWIHFQRIEHVNILCARSRTIPWSVIGIDNDGKFHVLVLYDALTCQQPRSSPRWMTDDLRVIQSIP